jgi:CRP/FNR family transcriptional regulator, anaerobic regulatory protein
MDSAVAEKVEAFFKQFKRQVYKRGDTLIRADDDPSGIFYLKNGSVKQYAISQKGDELVVNIFKPVSFFPMSWAVNNTTNSYYFEAITDIEVWKAPGDKVVEFIKENPDVMYDLLRRVYKGTDGILLRVTFLMSGSAYARLITELLIQARRFGKTEDDMSYELKITESDLATSAGMTRETVSREMKALKNKELVTLNNGAIIIHDITKLEEELSYI